MKGNKNIFFLYSSLPGYMLNCIEYFVEKYDYSVHIISYPKSKDAPYKIKTSNKIKFYNRHDLNYSGIITLIDEIKPELLLVSGWFDKEYLKTAKSSYIKGTRTVCLIDNFYKSTLKQRVGIGYLKYVLKKSFHKAWVPGTRQFAYASRLGFAEKNIETGLYCANSSVYTYNDDYKAHDNGTKTLLFLGRLTSYKRPLELVELYNKLNGASFNWKLLFIGNGPEKSKIKTTDNIKTIEFVQPHDLSDIINNIQAFALPSSSENYGVTIQEFVKLGVPIFCSDEVGAQKDLVVQGYNGWVFNADSLDSFEGKLKELFQATNDQLIEMHKNARNQGRSINEAIWSKKIISFIND